MTTIACDGKRMAGDGQSSTKGTIASTKTVKVFRLKDGSLFGACGTAGWGEKLMQWIDAGQEGEAPKGETGDVFMLLKPDKSLWQGGDDGIAVPIEAPFAIGSGMDFAIGAMETGYTAEHAVEVACRRDPNSGGMITSLALS